jgi:hypothetical protein
MPPELSAAWIAPCASESQLVPVLEAMDGVEAIVDNSVPLLAGPAVSGVPLALLVSVWLVESDDEANVGVAPGNSAIRLLGMDEMDIRLAQKIQSPHNAL